MVDTPNRINVAPTGISSPQGGSRSMTSLIGAVLVAALVGSGVAWFIIDREHTNVPAAASALVGAPKYIVHLEGFTVNLADPEETHFLRATIDLGIDRLPDGATKEKVASAMPVARIRDSILSVLTVCKADGLLTPEGKAQLKKNLLEALNRSVPELGIRDVYFTEFLVQR
jgi:flagellar FliL protein